MTSMWDLVEPVDITTAPNRTRVTSIFVLSVMPSHPDVKDETDLHERRRFIYLIEGRARNASSAVYTIKLFSNIFCENTVLKSEISSTRIENDDQGTSGNTFL